MCKTEPQALRPAGWPIILIVYNTTTMIQPEMPYNHYCSLHKQFIEEYKVISSRVADLYQAPRKFIEDNAMEMDRYMAESSVPGSPGDFNPTSFNLKEFIYRVEDFKLQIMSLFFEHRALIEKCTVYMQRVHELKASGNGPEVEHKLVELIPELTTLRFGLKCIEEKAGGMVSRLDSIEGNWNSINGKIAA